MATPSDAVVDAVVDVVVIGGGVVGLSTARELAKRGARVTLLDRATRGGDGSRAAAGVAVPSIRLLSDGAMIELTSAARLALDEDLAALERAFPGGLRRGRGILRPAVDTAARNALEAQARGREDFLGRWLGQQELVALEPALAGTPVAGAFLEDAAYLVDAESYLDALLHDAAAHGVTLRLGEAVLAVEVEPAQVVIRTTLAALRADRVIVAAGAWSGQLPGLPALPVRPVRGQMISTFHPSHRLTRILSGPVYLAPWRGGEVLVGATEEEAGFASHPTAQGMLLLIATLAKLAPSLREARFTAAWAGLRAATPGGRPMIGAYPGLPRVLIASGHGGQGILCGAVTGRLVSDLLDGRAAPFGAAFDPATVAAMPPRP